MHDDCGRISHPLTTAKTNCVRLFFVYLWLVTFYSMRRSYPFPTNRLGVFFCRTMIVFLTFHWTQCSIQLALSQLLVRHSTVCVCVCYELNVLQVNPSARFFIIFNELHSHTHTRIAAHVSRFEWNMPLFFSRLAHIDWNCKRCETEQPRRIAWFIGWMIKRTHVFNVKMSLYMVLNALLQKMPSIHDFKKTLSVFYVHSYAISLSSICLSKGVHKKAKSITCR